MHARKLAEKNVLFPLRIREAAKKRVIFLMAGPLGGGGKGRGN